MKIINLTQHAATPEQVAEGVFEHHNPADIKEQLTFTQLPDLQELWETAQYLAGIAKSSGADAAMIGGAPYLMAPLEWELQHHGIKVLYAFSVRESVDLGDGVKQSVFRHAGWVEV